VYSAFQPKQETLPESIRETPMTEVATPTGEGLVDESAVHLAQPPVSAAYRTYALWLLMLIYVVSFLDRQVINILAEPIKNDLGLSDTQLGLLSGFAFGIVYTFLGFPLARAADRYNRPWIIAGCLTAWSGFTVACGYAQNFAQLLIFRGGVGVGEAGCTPTSHALIADYTPKTQRARALAFYAMGTPIGSLLGLALGGYLADTFGWRQAFLVAGLPGLIFAVMAVLTLKEPRAMVKAAAAKTTEGMASFVDTFRYLAKKRAFWFLAFGAGVRAWLGYGIAPFLPSFFYRCHGPEMADLAARFGMKPQTFVGIAIGLMTGVGGAIGSWAGGQIADRWGAKDLRIFGSMPALAVLVAAPLVFFNYLTPNGALALGLTIIPSILGTLWYGPVYSSAQGMVPQNMRAMSASIMLFVINFLGLVCGALSVGAFSDLFNKGLGMGSAEGVRWALIAATAIAISSSLLFWLARGRIREEMVS
jgi:MFS family permease